MEKNLYYYYDPNHGGCLRIVNKTDRNNYIIKGAYGSDEGKKGYWWQLLKKNQYLNIKEKNII